MRKPIPRCSSRRFSCGVFVWMALASSMCSRSMSLVRLRILKVMLGVVVLG